MSPREWALPSLEVARDCLGLLPNVQGQVPVGSLVADISCDRTCDFCMTPTYGTGYRRMSPERVLQWLEIQKRVGARPINIGSDQFLARGPFPGGTGGNPGDHAWRQGAGDWSDVAQWPGVAQSHPWSRAQL